MDKQIAYCALCVHADKEKMKCFPNSKDCRLEYDLTEEDFTEINRCDFFERKTDLSGFFEKFIDIYIGGI